MNDSLIGTDEAGYGPNFGPLTIAACHWKMEDCRADLYQLLADVVAPDRTSDNRLFIGDSKDVYKKGDLAALELPVLALICSIQDCFPHDANELLSFLIPKSHSNELLNQFWVVAGTGKQNEVASLVPQLPIACTKQAVFEVGDRFREACISANVQLQQVVCLPIFADRFNFLLRNYQNKASLLTGETLQMVRLLLDEIQSGDVRCYCDKHGGRSKYAALIQQFVTDQWVSVGVESLEVSEYRSQHRGHDLEIVFAARGESNLATAFSSMVAKYIREITMLVWNQFWRQFIPNLKPTQGYPQDAKRFMNDIDQVCRQLGITGKTIWRER